MKTPGKLVLLSAAAVCALTGCGGKKADDEKVMEADFLISSSAPNDEQFIWRDILEEQFGIKANFEMAAQDAHLEKLQLLIASNNLPDLVSPIPSDTAKKIGASGMLVNYNDHLDEMPDYAKTISSDPVSYAAMFADDGGLYIAPQIIKDGDVVSKYRYVPTIRADLVEETGLEIPQSFEELYDVLTAVKQKHPDSLGLINRTGTDAFKDYGFHFGTRPDVCYSYEEDKFVFGPETQNYRAMLEYMNKLWKEGLMDPEFFTASKTQFESKLVNGLGAFYIDWGEYSATYARTHGELGADDGFSLMPIGPITSAAYSRPIVQQSEPTNLYCSMAVSSKSEAADRIMKFINWLYTDEGADVSQYGIKDTHYNVTEDGKYKFVSSIAADYNPDGTKARDTDFGINLPHIRRITTNKEYQAPDAYMKQTQEAMEKYEQQQCGYRVNNGINLTYTDDETETKSEISSDITTCVNEWSIGLVTGTKSFDDYDKFIAEAKGKGVDKLVDIYNAAYDRLKKKQEEISEK